RPRGPLQRANGRGGGRPAQRRRGARDALSPVAPLGGDPAGQEVLRLLRGRAGEGEVVVEPTACPLREPDDRHHGQHPACQDPAPVVIAPGGYAAEPARRNPADARPGRAPPRRRTPTAPPTQLPLT